jgi:3-oxoacyl-[acyl-carrier protein] reductase
MPHHRRRADPARLRPMIHRMDLGIRGRRAVIGGASSGIGAAVADALAAEGCNLLVWARDQARLEAVAQDLRARHGVEVAATPLDIGDPGAPELIEEAVRTSLGGADICVLNAGGPAPVDPLATDASGWHAAFASLAIHPILIASRLIGPMRKQGWGRVVACMSWSVKEPIPNLAYSSSGRSALASWMKTVAPVVAVDGVTVNGVLTGPTATPRIDELDQDRAQREGRDEDEVRAERIASIPAGRLATPAEIAAQVAYLCSEQSAFQTGTFTLVDGGMVRAL